VAIRASAEGGPTQPHGKGVQCLLTARATQGKQEGKYKSGGQAMRREEKRQKAHHRHYLEQEGHSPITRRSPGYELAGWLRRAADPINGGSAPNDGEIPSGRPSHQ